jgi:roadblock/LC7 domain-containing protein
LVELLDLTGRIITVPTEEDNTIINGTSLATGKYIVRLYTNKGVFIEEVVVLID